MSDENANNYRWYVNFVGAENAIPLFRSFPEFMIFINHNLGSKPFAF